MSALPAVRGPLLDGGAHTSDSDSEFGNFPRSSKARRSSSRAFMTTVGSSPGNIRRTSHLDKPGARGSWGPDGIATGHLDLNDDPHRTAPLPSVAMLEPISAPILHSGSMREFGGRGEDLLSPKGRTNGSRKKSVLDLMEADMFNNQGIKSRSPYESTGSNKLPALQKSPSQHLEPSSAVAADYQTNLVSSLGVEGSPTKGKLAPLPKSRQSAVSFERLVDDSATVADHFATVERVVAATDDRPSSDPGVRAMLFEVLFESNYTLASALHKISHDIPHLDQLAKSLVYVGESQGQTLHILQAVFRREIMTTTHPSQLFRTNNLASKMWTVFGSMISSTYLRQTLSPLMTAIDELNSVPEVETDKGTRLVSGSERKANLRVLTSLVTETLASIIESAKRFPRPLRVILHFIRGLIADRFPAMEIKALGAFVFLRLLCPALTSPQNTSFPDASDSPVSMRTRLLVAKILAKVANQGRFEDREPGFLPLNSLLATYEDSVIRFLLHLTDVPPVGPDHPMTSIPPATVDRSVSMLLSTIKTNLNAIRGHYDAVVGDGMVAIKPPVSGDVFSRLVSILKESSSSRGNLQSLQDVLLDDRFTIVLALCDLADDQVNTYNVSEALLQVFEAAPRTGSLSGGFQLLQRTLRRDILSAASRTSVFRAHSLSTRLFWLYCNMIGSTHLRRILDPAFEILLVRPDGCEIDPAKAPDARQNVETLTRVCQAFVDALISAPNEWPVGVRAVVHNTIEIVSNRFSCSDADASRLVASLLIQRFVCPTIAAPGAVLPAAPAGSADATASGSGPIPTSQVSRRAIVLVAQVLGRLCAPIPDTLSVPNNNDPLAVMAPFVAQNDEKLVAFVQALAKTPATEVSSVPIPKSTVEQGLRTVYNYLNNTVAYLSPITKGADEDVEQVRQALKPPKLANLSIANLTANQFRSQYFQKYLVRKHTIEHWLLLVECNEFAGLVDKGAPHEQVQAKADGIFRMFIQTDAPLPVNINAKTRETVDLAVNAGSGITKELFQPAIAQATDLLERDCIPSFLESDLCKEMFTAEGSIRTAKKGNPVTGLSPYFVPITKVIALDPSDPAVRRSLTDLLVQVDSPVALAMCSDRLAPFLRSDVGSQLAKSLVVLFESKLEAAPLIMAAFEQTDLSDEAPRGMAFLLFQAFAKMVAARYLAQCIGTVVQRVMDSPEEFELDAAKAANLTPKKKVKIKSNAKRVVSAVKSIIDNCHSTPLPPALTKLIKQLAQSKKINRRALVFALSRDLLASAVAHPERFNVSSTAPTVDSRRSLNLISTVLVASLCDSPALLDSVQLPSEASEIVQFVVRDRNPEFLERVVGSSQQAMPSAAESFPISAAVLNQAFVTVHSHLKSFYVVVETILNP